MKTVMELHNTGLSSNAIGEAVGTTGMTIRRLLHRHSVRLHGRDNSGEGHSHWRNGITARDGYVLVMRKGHPRADHQGYVNRSILVWEEANGRPFPDGHVPHHVNRLRYDDRPENIRPLTPADHAKEHHKC